MGREGSTHNNTRTNNSEREESPGAKIQIFCDFRVCILCPVMWAHQRKRYLHSLYSICGTINIHEFHQYLLIN